MNIEQTANLLAKVSVYDHRQVDQATILAWHESIGHLDYDEALMAVGVHFRQANEYLMPAHITKLTREAQAAEWREEQRKPLPSTKGAPKPDNFDAMVAAYRDPQAFAVEVGRYDHQLVEAGYEPTNVSVGGSPHGVTIHHRYPVAATPSRD